MLNVIRVQVRATARVIDDSGQTVNKDLPDVVKRTHATSEVVARSLPEVEKTLPRVIDRVDRTSEVLAGLAEDVKQLKELAGLTNVPRDQTVSAYADSVLKQIASSGGVVGVRKMVGKGLKNPAAAAEWAAKERREAVFMALLGRSKKEMLKAIVTTKLGLSWYIQLPGQEPVKLVDWLRENHAETKELG
jgi:hypothetical protein